MDRLADAVFVVQRVAIKFWMSECSCNISNYLVGLTQTRVLRLEQKLEIGLDSDICHVLLDWLSLHFLFAFRV